MSAGLEEAGPGALDGQRAGGPALRLQRYRLVVFDWDGTVVDSIAAIVGCTRCALVDAGVAAPPDEVLRGAVGLGLDDTFERYHPGLDQATRRHVLDRYRHHWIETWHRRHEPFVGAAPTFAHLEAAGKLLAVATAKSRRGLIRDFERTGLGRWFAATRTLDECPPKPAPEMLLQLMDELGARPADTLMVGDSRWDMEMARNAGVDAVAVLGGAHVESELRSCGPLDCLPHVGELPGWLGRAV